MLKDTELQEAAFNQQIGQLTGRRWKARLIEGDKVGSSAYYPAEVLRRDGPQVFKKGTPIFLNHQTPDEKILRPFGSVQDYAGELIEDAYYDGDGLYAEIEVFEHHAPLVKALSERIGMSIRAKGETDTATINGRMIPVAQNIKSVSSVDLVMKAGAGGKLVSLLESALDDSETDSETENEGQVMEKELTEALAALATAQTAMAANMAELAESLKPATVEVVKPEVEVEESAVDVLAKAKELADSELTEEGRTRVWELHTATKKPLSELIESEKAHEAKLVAAKPAAEDGFEESADLEESAHRDEIKIPSIWNKKKDK